MAHMFGARVIGKEAADAQAIAHATAANIFGSRVVDTPQVDNSRPAITAPAGTSYSLAELKALLAENPAHYTDVFQAEFARPDGPRKAALQEFLKLEMARPEGPAEKTLAVIEKALGG